MQFKNSKNGALPGHQLCCSSARGHLLIRAYSRWLKKVFFYIIKKCPYWLNAAPPTGNCKIYFHHQYLVLWWRTVRNLPINLLQIKLLLGNMFNTVYQMILLYVLLGGTSVPGELQQPSSSRIANTLSLWYCMTTRASLTDFIKMFAMCVCVAQSIGDGIKTFPRTLCLYNLVGTMLEKHLDLYMKCQTVPNSNRPHWASNQCRNVMLIMCPPQSS